MCIDVKLIERCLVSYLNPWGERPKQGIAAIRSAFAGRPGRTLYHCAGTASEQSQPIRMHLEQTETRFVKDARKPLQQAKQVANKRPDAIVTDGLQAYNEAVKAEFFDMSANIQNPHVRLKDFETKPNNNIVERLNGTFRERTKVMRSLDTKLTASEFVAGLQTYYNYIRPHQGIGGLTPAQMANIPVNLMGNRWETMIGLASGK